MTVSNKFGPTYFTIKDHKQKVVHTGVTPQQVTLQSKRAPFIPAKYEVDFIGENNATDRQELKPGFEPWVAGNLLLGGAIGVVVDGASGAMFKMPKEIIGNVPSVYAVTETQRGSEIAAAGAGAGENPQYAARSKSMDSPTSGGYVRTASGEIPIQSRTVK